MHHELNTLPLWASPDLRAVGFKIAVHGSHEVYTEVQMEIMNRVLREMNDGIVAASGADAAFSAVRTAELRMGRLQAICTEHLVNTDPRKIIPLVLRPGAPQSARDALQERWEEVMSAIFEE